MYNLLKFQELKYHMHVSDVAIKKEALLYSFLQTLHCTDEL